MKDAIYEALSAKVGWHEAPVDQLCFSIGNDAFTVHLDGEVGISRSYVNVLEMKPAPHPSAHLERKLVEQALEYVTYYTCENGPLKGRLVACFGLDAYLLHFYPVSLERVSFSKWATLLIPDEMLNTF